MRRRVALVVLLALVPASLAVPVGPACAQENAEETPRTRIRLAVGEVHSIPAARVRSYSSSGPLLEVRFDAAKRALEVWLVRAGTTSLLLIDEDGTQRRLELEAR